MKLSVVITAFNEEKKIEECLESVMNLTEELIVVDNNSTDRTLEVSKKYTDKIFHQENDPLKIDYQKNFGISKATGDWVLILDADERVTEDLAEEIRQILDIGSSMEENVKLKQQEAHPASSIQHPTSEANGYWIPRKNIIFGKRIENTGWYPDYQLRLFRNGKGTYKEGGVHKELSLIGKTLKLKNPILHLNYDNISSFVIRMDRYTTSEAKGLTDKNYKYNSFDIMKMPISEFIKRYFAQSGYKDGMHGLVLSLLMAFYHLVVFLKLWESKGYPDEKNNNELLLDASRMIKKEFKYWSIQSKINETQNIFKKKILKVKRKISL